MPNCIILRGLPGSGKSTKAKTDYPGYVIVSADQYFEVDGEYLFNKDRLYDAHQFCVGRFVEAVKSGKDVVVDNTNLSPREWKKYFNYASDYKYTVEVVTIETDLTDEELAKRNVHGVPVETIKRMRQRMKGNEL